jgi:hypothetical protein
VEFVLDDGYSDGIRIDAKRVTDGSGNPLNEITLLIQGAAGVHSYLDGWHLYRPSIHGVNEPNPTARSIRLAIARSPAKSE